MPNGVFESHVQATPAVSASGTGGATGVSASSDSGTGLNVQVGSVEPGLVPDGTGIYAGTLLGTGLMVQSGDTTEKGQGSDGTGIQVYTVLGTGINVQVGTGGLAGQGPSNGIGVIATTQAGAAGQFNSGGIGIEVAGAGCGVQATGYVGVIASDPSGTAPEVLGPTGLQASGAYAGVQAVSEGGTAGIFSNSAAVPGEANVNPALDASTTSTGAAAHVHSDLIVPPGSALSPSPALVVDGPQFVVVIERPTGISLVLSGPAASFNGSVDVTGAFTATAKSFVIDHPLDPANKYLAHASVESSEQANVYSGNIVLDDNGEAVVNLPAWAEAVNGDFRYQLTCVGRSAPVYVAAEVADNQFSIAGGAAGMKVSWQLTGIRKDAWAMAHPLVVEQDKSAGERGYFRHPELFGSDRQHSIAHTRRH
jgi:trimeric autotransporter adhesin